MSKSIYKRLGDYIRLVDVRNKDLEVTKLLGVSISKTFIPSIANTIGTDMSTYKIVKPMQFAYGPVTSRNGDKVSVALLLKEENAIISQAYTVFEVLDINKLLPKYLMMWFRRPEFDRYARYKSHGSAREIFDWETMCDVEMPIPAIEKQQKIVAEYESLSNRIRINEQMIAKLEDTAQALYHKMFVDGIDKENLPEGWRMGTIGDVAEFRNGTTISPTCGEIPIYGGNGIVGYHHSHNAENIIVIGRVGANCGNIKLERRKCWINDNAMLATSKHETLNFLYWLLRELNLNSKSEGSGQPLLTQAILNSLETTVPTLKQILQFDKQVEKFERMACLINQDISLINELQSLLLSKVV